MNWIIEQQNVLLLRRNSALIHMLESEGISYEQQEDGSIFYEYEF